MQSGGCPDPRDRAADLDADRLYRNRGDGTFEDVTARAGVVGPGYGIGVAVADYDRDGWVDLYVTNLGANALYRNRGDGTFADVTARRRASATPATRPAPRSSTTTPTATSICTSSNYLEVVAGHRAVCLGRGGLRGYCSPREYGRAQSDTLYRNDGDGTFTDVSARAGHRAPRRPPGWAWSTADFDGDGWVDVYVANDQMPNHLWINTGDGTFREEALVRGCALDELGLRAGGDGSRGRGRRRRRRLGPVRRQPHAARAATSTATSAAATSSTPPTSCGLGARHASPTPGSAPRFFDYDNDGRLDVFIANGKVGAGRRRST